MSEAKWYVLHTYSGYENKVKNDIIKLVENGNLHHLIEEVMVPTTTEVEVREGKNHEKIEHTYESKLFPCYVYVKMVMTDQSWYICRNIRGVTGFVGPGSKPVPLTDEEVAHLGVVEKSSTAKFAAGENVKIISGSFIGMEAVVESVDEANNTIKVSVSMFGRNVSAELELSAVQKIEF